MGVRKKVAVLLATFYYTITSISDEFLDPVEKFIRLEKCAIIDTDNSLYRKEFYENSNYEQTCY